MRTNFEEKEVYAAIDECVRQEFTDGDPARDVSVFLALTLLDHPLADIDLHYSLSKTEIDAARHNVAVANSGDRMMASRVGGCRLAAWKRIMGRNGKA